MSVKSVENTRKRRANFSSEIIKILEGWLFENLQHPFPTEEQKALFMDETGLTKRQIDDWFINARRRKVDKSQNKAAQCKETQRKSTVDDRIQSLNSDKRARICSLSAKFEEQYDRMQRRSGENRNTVITTTSLPTIHTSTLSGKKLLNNSGVDHFAFTIIKNEREGTSIPPEEIKEGDCNLRNRIGRIIASDRCRNPEECMNAPKHNCAYDYNLCLLFDIGLNESLYRNALDASSPAPL